MHFERTISPFVRAIRAETIDLRHASVILVHFEQFGAVFDQWVRVLIQDLRDEGVYGRQGEAVARIIFETFRDVRRSSVSTSDYECISTDCDS